MGYSTSYGGEDAVLTIDPPLTYPEICESFFSPQNRAKYEGFGVTLDVDEEHIQTPEGPLIRQTAARAVIVGDELRHDEIMEQLRDFLVQHGRRHGHEITGLLHCNPDHPDMNRFRVRVADDRVTEIHPTLVWPDDPAALETVKACLRYDVPAATEVSRLAVNIIGALTKEANR